MENKKDYKPIIIYLSMTFGLGFLLGIFAAIIGYRELTAELLSMFTFIPGLLVFIPFIIIYHKKIINDIKSLDKKKILTIIISAIVLITLNELLSRILISLGVSFDNQNNIEEMLGSSKTLMIIYIAIIAPLIEEFVFRYSLDTIIKNNKTFIIVSGILFGIMHSTNISIIVYAFIGSALAYIYTKNDKNIIVTTLIHMLNNIVSVLLMLLI